MVSSKTWGLDIGSTGIKAVEITRTWRSLRVSNYVFSPFSSKEKEGVGGEKLHQLREILPKLQKGGEGLILSVASHRTMVHRIPLPFRDRKKNQQIVKFEVEPLLPFPIDQVVVDFSTSEKNQNGKEALVFAVQKETLGEQISLVKEAGLDPERAVPEALALFWLAKNLGETSGANGALLDLGQEKTTMIVWRDDTLALVRSIPIAGAAMALERGSQPSLPEGKEFMKKKGGTPESQPIIEAVLGRLAGEVHRTFLSYEYGADGPPLENVFLTGGSALLPGVGKILSENLQKPVSLLNLGENSFFRDVPKEYHSVLAVAMGAALGGSVPDRINFLQGEFVSPKKARKVKTQAKLLVSYAVILAVLGVVTFLLNLYFQERKYQALKAEIRKEFLQAAPEIKKVVNEVQQMKARVGEEKARLDSLGGSSGAGSPLEIIRDLSQMVEPGWKVRVTEVVVAPESVELNGEADSFDTVNQLKNKLDRSSRYKEVQLKTARASGLENVIEFKLQMKRGM